MAEEAKSSWPGEINSSQGIRRNPRGDKAKRGHQRNAHERKRDIRKNIGPSKKGRFRTPSKI